MNFPHHRAAQIPRPRRFWRLGTLAALAFAALAALALCSGPTARAQSLESGNLMTGTRYQTPYFIRTGAQAGPTIVIIGGLHGDEPAGYLAARRLKNWKITRGTLVLVPDSNRIAIEANQRFVGRNMNRQFPGQKDGDPMQQLAGEIWDLIKSSKPDLVLTLHESRGFHADEPKRYGQTFTYDFPVLSPRFKRVAAAVNAEIPLPKQHFLQFIDPFPTCPTYVTYKFLHVPATSIETAKPLPLQRRVELQLIAIRGFCREWGLEWEENGSRAVSSAQRTPGATAPGAASGAASGAATPLPTLRAAPIQDSPVTPPSATAPALSRS